MAQIKPTMVSTNKNKPAKEPAKKKSTIVHKTEKPVQDIIQLLGEIERTIRELTVALSETEASKHMGARGLPKLTAKQIEIKEQIKAAQRRYDMTTKLLR